MKRFKITFFLLLPLIWSCGSGSSEEGNSEYTGSGDMKKTEKPAEDPVKKKIEAFAEFELKTDLSKLSAKEKQMIPLLIKAAQYMDSIFWLESYGDRNELMQRIQSPYARIYAEMNYGPWDRMDEDKPFVAGFGPKPLGANFYPHDMTKEEFEKAPLKDKADLYTLIRRDSAGKLITVPYRDAFRYYNDKVSELLLEAADLVETPGLFQYLVSRATAILSDEYRQSDIKWMQMKDNHLDIVIGPVETYEDKLFGYKAAHEAYVLVKDLEWSERLKKYLSYLPALQSALPVPDKYKREKPGARSDLNAYDAIYYAGEANTGGKTIAINLPNDEYVQLHYGSRRLQLKNVMQAKFEKILVPISRLLIDSKQRDHIRFDAFFTNTMFHEVAHGLGIKNTINGRGPVRTALKEHYSAIEEGKADILGLFMVTELLKRNVLEGDIKDYMTTFMASIFRSIRFGAHEAHGLANLIRFNYFKEKGAFSRNSDGTYTVHYDKMEAAINDLSRLILTLQGNGDYEGVKQLVDQYGKTDAQLQADLERVNNAGIPVDIRFKQGLEVLGLNQ